MKHIRHDVFVAHRIAGSHVELTLDHHDGYTLAAISGPLDDSATEAFRQSLHPLYNQRGAKLIVDLAASPRVTSEGLTAMVRLVTDANTRGGRVIFAAPGPFVSEVIRVTRLDRFFEVAPTLPEAVERLS